MNVGVLHNERQNNFDFLRILFAVFVLITHAYMFTGISDCDWLCQLSGGQTYFTDIAVKGFFIISGYLVYQSMQRSSSTIDYLWRRILRIYPGMIVVLLLTVCLGWLVYQGIVPYWQNRSVWTYVPYNLSLYIKQTVIEGVFQSNPHNATINGSLWTIAYEFAFYLLLALLFRWRQQRMFLGSALALLLAIAVCMGIVYGESLLRFGWKLNAYHVVQFGAAFLAGSLLAHVGWLERLRGRGWWLAAVGLLLLSFWLYWYSWAGYFLLPLAVLLVGQHYSAWLNWLPQKLGDISYGVYIYGSPVQQTLVYFYQPSHGWLFLFSLPITLLLGWLSWRWVEKPALQRWKAVFNRKVAGHFSK
jgi:peptidoglycan/LPS O-acetylase OafA/YrhL